VEDRGLTGLQGGECGGDLGVGWVGLGWGWVCRTAEMLLWIRRCSQLVHGTRSTRRRRSTSPLNAREATPTYLERALQALREGPVCVGGRAPGLGAVQQHLQGAAGHVLGHQPAGASVLDDGPEERHDAGVPQPRQALDLAQERGELDVTVDAHPLHGHVGPVPARAERLPKRAVAEQRAELDLLGSDQPPARRAARHQRLHLRARAPGELEVGGLRLLVGGDVEGVLQELRRLGRRGVGAGAVLGGELDDLLLLLVEAALLDAAAAVDPVGAGGAWGGGVRGMAECEGWLLPTLGRLLTSDSCWMVRVSHSTYAPPALKLPATNATSHP